MLAQRGDEATVTIDVVLHDGDVVRGGVPAQFDRRSRLGRRGQILGLLGGSLSGAAIVVKEKAVEKDPVPTELVPRTRQ